MHVIYDKQLTEVN